MKKAEAGVTLMELLIAVSLVSLLSVGMLFAIRVGVKAMETANSRLLANRRVLGVERILENQIAGFVPVVTPCVAGGPPSPPLAFFQGEPETMRFVSAYSLEEAWRGYPRLLEFHVIAGQNGRGVRLVVNEHLYAGPVTAGRFCFGLRLDQALGVAVPAFPPVQVNERSYVLADKLAHCRMIYREQLPPPMLERWVPRWILPKWPGAVRVEMAPLEPDPSRLQVMTVTAPIRVTRDPMTSYVD